MRFFKELWMTFRVVPVIQWTILNSVIVLASALYLTGKVDLLSWFMASAVAWVTQGFLSHVFNDIYDWIHGTDKLVDVDKTITGGSHTIQQYYMGGNVFGHLRNLLPWFIVSLISAYYFLFIMQWSWYVFYGAALAVVIGVFYSAPPAKTDHRPFLGEWVVAFGGLMSCNVLLFYAAAHTVAVKFIAISLPYVMTNIIMLKMHHVNDVFPDLRAETKKYTSISWIYERYGLDAVMKYFIAILLTLTLVGLVVSWTAVVYAVVFVPLAVYGYRLIESYKSIDLDKYPDYLSYTLPPEVNWIIASIIVGAIYAGLMIITTIF